MESRLTIVLSDQELTALRDVARQELRAMRDQVRLIVRKDLERRGLLQCENADADRPGLGMRRERMKVIVGRATSIELSGDGGTTWTELLDTMTEPGKLSTRQDGISFNCTVDYIDPGLLFYLQLQEYAR